MTHFAMARVYRRDRDADTPQQQRRPRRYVKLSCDNRRHPSHPLPLLCVHTLIIITAGKLHYTREKGRERVIINNAITTRRRDAGEIRNYLFPHPVIITRRKIKEKKRESDREEGREEKREKRENSVDTPGSMYTRDGTFAGENFGPD